MVDRDLLLKKVAFIRSCLRELHELAHPEQIHSDLREERFVVHTLQLACQAAIDLASHVVSDRVLGEPQSNRELFVLLERAGLIDSTLSASLARLAGFRNVIVHGYERVSLAVVEDIVRHRLTDLERFAEAMAKVD